MEKPRPWPVQPKSPRKSWEFFFIDMAYLFASRSTCDRKHVGCVIVNDQRHVIATGYNGSMPGQPHCDDVGHLMLCGRSGCQRTSHAEASALAQAARYGHSVLGCTAYITVSPCIVCAKLMIMAGIDTVCFHELYRESHATQLLESSGVSCVHLVEYVQ